MSSGRHPFSPPLSAPSVSKLSPVSPSTVPAWRSHSSGGPHHGGASTSGVSGHAQIHTKRRSSINSGSRFFQFPPPATFSGSSSKKGSRSGSGSGASSSATRKASNAANAIFDFLTRSIHSGAAVVESMQNKVYCYLILGQSPKEMQEEELRQRRQQQQQQQQFQIFEASAMTIPLARDGKKFKLRSPLSPRKRKSRRYSPPIDPRQDFDPQSNQTQGNQARVKDALYDSGSVIGLVAGVGIHETKAHTASASSCLLPYASYVNGCAGGGSAHTTTTYGTVRRGSPQLDLFSPPSSSPTGSSSSTSTESEDSFEIGNLESPSSQDLDNAGYVDENTDRDLASASTSALEMASEPGLGIGMALATLCTW